MTVHRRAVKCQTKYCKHYTTGAKLCSTCRSRETRKKNVMRYAFITLRNNCKRRGIEFELSFEQFETFAQATRYIAGKGRSKDSYTIDRIDNTKGYVIGNIRVISKSENSKKGTKRLIYDWRQDPETGQPYAKVV